MIYVVLLMQFFAEPMSDPMETTVDLQKSCVGDSPLHEKDPGLQREIAAILEKPEMQKLVRGNQLAVSVADITYQDTIYYAGVNDDEMMYAASLPKIAILLAVLQLVQEGTLFWDFSYRYRLQKMITVSDNGFAAWGADLATLKPIAKILQQEPYCLYEPPLGGLWVGRSYRKGGPNNLDPVENLSHAATTRQTTRFYLLLERQQLVSPYFSARMLNLMGPPEHKHKFVKGLEGIKGVKFIARKSGTWRAFHSDSALIQHHGKRYILAALSESYAGETILREIAKEVDPIIMRGVYRQ